MANRVDAPGSNFCKVDFHIHTPQSYDYKDKAASGHDIVKAALDADLDAIAITDHNDYRFIDNVRDAAVGTGLTVFPGVEISTRDGHLLALFDPSASVDIVKDLIAQSGIKTAMLGQPEANCNQTIEAVAQMVANQGGLSIPAHVDAPKGFLEAVNIGQTKISILQDESISVLEIMDSSKLADWLEGKQYSVIKGCIQGSDAHSLAQIGTRFCWIKIANFSIDGLRLAFADPALRIKLKDGYADYSTRRYIEKLEVSQGFFGNLQVMFNPGLNCIIGGQGVGKSALIEFLRFALNNASPFSDIRKDHIGKLSKLLREGGKISVTFHNRDGNRYKVTRTFDNHQNPVVIERVFPDRLEEYPLTLHESFPIHAYSQGEGMSIARDPVKQLDLIDSHFDLSKEKQQLDSYKQELAANTFKLQQIYSKLLNQDEKRLRKQRLEKEIAEVEKNLRLIKEVEKKPAIRDNQYWEDERNYLTGIRKSLESFKEDLLKPFNELSYAALERELPVTKLGNDDELNNVKGIASGVRNYVEQLKNNIDAEFSSFFTEMLGKTEKWRIRYKTHEAAYKEAQSQIQDIEAITLNARLSNLKRDWEASNLEVSQIEEINPQREVLVGARKQLLRNISKYINGITDARRRQAKEMTKSLANRVLISVQGSKNTEAYLEWLHNHIKSRSVNKNHLEAVASKLSPQQLALIIREQNRDEFIKQTGLSQNVSSSFLTEFLENPALVDSLEEIFLDDLPNIQMRLNNGEYRSLDELSTGQKFTVIILLALCDDDKPIIYDQPEDALDAALIYTDIAKKLRHTKDDRQFIFATHNPNISVSSDLDLAIVIEGSANKASVSDTGGLEEKNVNRQLVQYLEGGSEAIKHRINKYNLNLH